MKRLATAAVLAAACLISTGLTAEAAASAAVRPARPVVFEVTTGGHAKSAVKPSLFRITAGPGLYAKRMHWTRWGSRSATGTGNLYGVDDGTHFLGHATVHLYAVKRHHGTLYYSELHLTHQQGSVPYYSWSWRFHSWEGR